MHQVEMFANEKELKENINEINKLKRSIQLNSFGSINELNSVIKEKYCGQNFFIALPNFSDLMYLPVYNPECGPIIDITSNQLIQINSLDEISGSTVDFKLLLINLKKFSIDETEALFDSVIADYQNSVSKYASENKLKMDHINLEDIAEKCPLEIWIIVA